MGRSVCRGWMWLAALVVLALARPGSSQDAQQVRALLEARTGDLSRLRVPAPADLPQPRLGDGSLDPRFAITGEKVRLGKLLFFDPVRSSDIRTELGGVAETARTASCGSCHLGEAASKAAAVTSIGVGGEGRHLLEHTGSFSVSRTTIAGLVDHLPTGMEIRDAEGNLIESGGFDPIDSPPRVSPSVIGFAFNTRLLWGGEAGGPNPEGNPAQEDIVRIASMNHRMAGADLGHLQGNAVYRELFGRAFPDELGTYLSSGDIGDLIHLDTQVRAIAAFLRTVITRDTPWDRFLGGDDRALTGRQLRGAWLFAAEPAQGGAGCIECHSGPALNKRLGDEEGLLVEENFHNLGTLEHPLFALAREAFGDAGIHDFGRGGVTGDPAQRFAFKSPTLRQLRDAAPYFHGGQAGTLREVVEYFNAGLPADPLAGAEASLSSLFTNPLGEGTRGLGLGAEDVDALVDFLANGLRDPAFVHHDPASPTDMFELSMGDLTWEEDLLLLGAGPGWLPSGLPNGFNDPKSRELLVFVRGGANSDRRVDIADAVHLLRFLFATGAPPEPMVAGDVNDDSRVDIADPIYLIGFLFLGGSPPPYPYPESGQDLQR